MDNNKQEGEKPTNMGNVIITGIKSQDSRGICFKLNKCTRLKNSNGLTTDEWWVSWDRIGEAMFDGYTDDSSVEGRNKLRPLPSSVEEKADHISDVIGHNTSIIEGRSLPGKEMSAEEYLKSHSANLPGTAFGMVSEPDARHYANLRAMEVLRGFAQEKYQAHCLYDDVSAVHDEQRDYRSFDITDQAESYINKHLKG